MVKLLRIDRRLIHGQIAFAWTAYLDVNCILVANDDAAGDDIRMATLRLAKPQNTKLIIKSIDDSIAAFKSGKTDKYKIMIVVENVDDKDFLTALCFDFCSRPIKKMYKIGILC